MFRRIHRRIQCQHLNARSISGDEILWSGKRGHCGDCGAWLDELPLGFRGSGFSRMLKRVVEEMAR